LPASVFNGVFVGMQRNEIPAATIGGSKLLSALLLILAARHGVGLIGLASILAATNLASYVVQFMIFLALATQVRLSLEGVVNRTARELASYCGSLTVWTSAMLMITGLDLTIVAYFQFESVAYYAVAASAVSVIVGATNAIFSAMLPSAAVLQARGHARELGSLVLITSRYGMYVLLFVGIPLVLLAPKALMLWMGALYAVKAAPLLRWLVIANIIRLSGTPYSVAVLATGQQRLVLVSPILEGVTNLVCSVVAAHFLGAVGVAIGTFIGAVVGTLANLLYNMRRTREIDLSISRYVEETLTLPVACCLPLLLSSCAVASMHPSRLTAATLVLAGATCTFACVWKWSLNTGEKRRLRERAFGLV